MSDHVDQTAARNVGADVRNIQEDLGVCRVGMARLRDARLRPAVGQTKGLRQAVQRIASG